VYSIQSAVSATVWNTRGQVKTSMENCEVKAETFLDNIPQLEINGVKVGNEEIKVVIDNVEEEKSVDPWRYERSFPCWWVVLVLIVGPVLLPLRILFIFIIVSVSYLMAKIGLIGLDTDDQPLIGWRKCIQRILFLNIKLVGGCIGIWMIKKGKQASAKDAPILAVAPHSTFLDWLAVGHTKSSPVAKFELTQKIMFGVIGRLIQTVWVNRKTEESKKETADMIRKRSSESGWPQTLIFPEGTNTNGKALIQFRSGAFVSGKPVQPVVLSFNNTVDTLTWTWIQRFKPHHLFLFTLLTPITFINLEFLPVLIPTKEEEDNPRKFADRTQRTMCEHLNIPAVNQTMKDAIAARNDLKNSKDLLCPIDASNKSQSTSTTSIPTI